MNKVRLTYERVDEFRNEAIRDWITFLTDVYNEISADSQILSIKNRILHELRIPTVRELLTISEVIRLKYVDEGINAIYVNRLASNLYVENLVHSLNIVIRDITSGDVVIGAELNPPVNTGLPSISAAGGTAKVGVQLTVTDGTWTGDGITYSYQLRRNGSVNIGTNSNTYTLVAADAFNTVDCVVTATNGDGSDTATAPSTASVRYFFLDNDTFNRATLGPEWSEYDPGGNLTVTVNNPTVTLAGGAFTISSRNINYNTVLTTAVRSWKMTLRYNITVNSGGISIGTRNPVNPTPNWAIAGRMEASNGKVQIYSGTGSTTDDDEQIQRVESTGSLTLQTGGEDYIIEFERQYSGSGDATYIATMYRVNSPGTTVSCQWVETGASSQSQYNSAEITIGAVSGTHVVKSVSMELLN